MNRQEDFEADDMTPPRGRVGRGLNGTPMRAAPAVETAELPMGARVGQALAPSWKGLDKVKLEDATAEGFETFWNALSVFMLFNFSVRIGDSHWTLNWRPMVTMNGMPIRNTNLPNGWNSTVDMVLYEVLRFGAEMFIGVLHQDGNVNPTMGIHALYNLVKVNARSKPSRMVETINKQSILSWDPSKGSEGYQSYMIEMQKLHAKLRVSDPQEAINLVTFMIVKNNAPTYIPAVESVVLQFTETQDSVDPIKLMQMIKSTLQGLEGQGKSLAQPTPSATRLESSAYRGAGPASGKQRTAFVAQGPKRSRQKNRFCFRCLKNDGHTVAECQTLEKDIDPDWQANVPEGLKHAISTWEHQRMRKASNSAYFSDSHELAERGHVLVDTGATDVLVHNLDMLVGVEKLSTSDQVEINIAKGGPLIATHRGTLKIKVITEGCRLRYLKVRNALYAPGLAVTLLGRDALEAEGIYIESGVNKPWTLVKPKEKLVIKLITNGGLLRVPAEYFVPQEQEVEEVTPTSKGDKDVPQELQQEVLETVKPKPKGFPGKKTLPVELAHRRLCHVGVSRLQDIEKNVDNFHVKIDEESRACPACGLSKSRLLAVPSGPHVQRVEGPRQGVSIDASGKKVMSIGGHRYFILFRDVFTKEIFVEFVKDLTAESLLDAFDHFVAKWSKGGEISPHVQIYADNAFLADEFEAVMTRRQWPIHACAAYEHWGNGIAERAIGSVVPLAQAAMAETKLPTKFWPYAIHMAAHVLSRIPPSSGGKSPYELGTGQRPDLSSLRVFGCYALVHRAHPGTPLEKSKFSGRARSGIYLGPSDTHTFGTSIFFMLDTHKLVYRRTATFFEYTFPSPQDHPEEAFALATAQSRGLDPVSSSFQVSPSLQGGEALDTLATSDDWDDVSTIAGSDAAPVYEEEDAAVEDTNVAQHVEDLVSLEDSGDEDEPDLNAEEDASGDVGDSAVVDEDSSDEGNVVIHNNVRYGNGMLPAVKPTSQEAQANILPTRLRPRTNAALMAQSDAAKRRRKILSTPERLLKDVEIDDLIADDPLDMYIDKVYAPEGTDLSKLTTPEHFGQIAKLPPAEQTLWLRAAEAEIEGMKRHNTFDGFVKEAVAKKTGEILPTIWAGKVKSSGRMKMRLCMRGNYEKGFTPGEFSSPTASMTEVFMGIVMGLSHKDWVMMTIDAKQAFLHPKLDRDVFMRPSKEVSRMLNVPPGHVVKLNKACYGLASASLDWYLHIRGILESFGLKACDTAPCMFTCSDLMLIIYVDDMVVFGTELFIKKLILHLQKNDIGITVDQQQGRLLGMTWKFDATARTVTFDMAEYEQSILTRFGLEGVHTARSPSTPNVQLPFLEGKESQDRYRNMVGCLVYLCNVRPELRNTVRLLSRHLHSNGPEHMKELERAYGYIKKTMGQTFTLTGVKESELNLKCYVDASWADCISTRSSTSGWMIFLGGSLILAKSKSQPAIAMSSMESEMYALSQAATDLCKMRRLFAELGGQLKEPSMMISDSQSTLATLRNHQFASRAKHLDIRELVVRDMLRNGEFDLYFVKTTHQLADILTKPVGVNVLQKLGSVSRNGLSTNMEFLLECQPEHWGQGVSEHREERPCGAAVPLPGSVPREPVRESVGKLSTWSTVGLASEALRKRLTQEVLVSRVPQKVQVPS